MEAKLNVCPNAVGGRTLLAKSFGLSQLINSGIYMLSVPETVILQTQKKLFAFLWKNETDTDQKTGFVPPIIQRWIELPLLQDYRQSASPLLDKQTFK